MDQPDRASSLKAGSSFGECANPYSIFILCLRF